ncbi:TPA: hypothetical protein L5Q58_006305 [Pseudomonas aeruginosa]|nr:hypothetical protein [Pseudomonas aeruginosa]HBP0677560.1 hypothetical protein [Pseudomonas aeruginosa]HBP0703203.1 hypothetical protein [Pseudomonas aeruginosa]HCT5055355.1 hypothetical protein [Pseudomonas aeruginosa]
MTVPQASKLDLNDWNNWIDKVRERSEASKAGVFPANLKMNSKNLVFENMTYVYGPMVIGLDMRIKRKTMWFLDVTHESWYEKDIRERTKTWAVTRMEFVESKNPMSQTDNLGLFEGLSISEHFIERFLERNNFRSKSDFSTLIKVVMAGIVRLDTKNLAEDLLMSGVKDIGIVTEQGVFYVALDSNNSSGRMILKTFISFDSMSMPKRSTFLDLLKVSSIYKEKLSMVRFAVISSRHEDGTYEIYDDFIKSYITSERYIPPPASVLQHG